MDVNVTSSKLKPRPVTATWFVPMFTFRATARARFRSCSAPYQKSLRYLPPVLATFPFIEYGPMQLYLDEGYAYVAMDTPGMGCAHRIAPKTRN